MPKNPNHKRWPRTQHDGRVITIDAEGFALRDEDHAWVRSMGGVVSVDADGIKLTYPSKKTAGVAFAGMVHEGRCNVDSVRRMTFVNEEMAELAAKLQGLTD